MKLINDIINELIDNDKSITSPLLKTKVLASRLQNEPLLNWVSNELKGYENLESIPDYRKYQANITGTYINGGMIYNDQPVPIIGLDKELEEAINAMNFTQSISTLETLKGENKSGILEQVFPAELIGLIQQNWRKMKNPYLQLVNCKKSISINVVTEILSFVRNNLLDFMLKIDSEFGNITEIEELKTKQEQITTIMTQTIINTSGDGNVVNTGNKTKITATITINKGDIKQLVSHLQEIGLSEVESSELAEIIDKEEPNYTNKIFGEKVNGWIQKMLGKALNGTWEIGVDAAGSLLAEAIKMYYGI